MYQNDVLSISKFDLRQVKGLLYVHGKFISDKVYDGAKCNFWTFVFGLETDFSETNNKQGLSVWSI